MRRFRPVLALIAAAALAARMAPRSSLYWRNQRELVIKTQQAKIPRIERLLALLDIKRGMTVVDIGTGTGQAAYLLAERLKGSGRVYATDIEPGLVAYVAAEARARGLSNLEARLVSPVGVDPFYLEHRWDLIILYDVATFLKERPEYYRKLRGCLAPGGRLVLVANPGLDYNFSSYDIADWPGLLADLKREPADTPFGRELALTFQQALASHDAGGGLSEEQLALYLINRSMSSSLYCDLARGIDFPPEVGFTDEERPFATWLLRRITQAGFPRRRGLMELSQMEAHDVELLNKLVLIQRYRRYLKGQPPPLPYLSQSSESRWQLRHDLNTKELVEAGFNIKRVEFPPFQAVWIATAR